MNILVIDAYDSFVHTIVLYLIPSIAWILYTQYSSKVPAYLMP